MEKTSCLHKKPWVRSEGLAVVCVSVFLTISISSFQLGCGAEGGTSSLGFDKSALRELGVASLWAGAFFPEDVYGTEVDCGVLLHQPSDTEALIEAAPSLIQDVNADAESVVLVMEELPPGDIWFLLLGYSEESGEGDIVAAGCGHGRIERGGKSTVVVLMEPID